jgi:flagellar basal-body rod protein FlgB
MLPNLTHALDFQAKALVIRADRQRVIASNIANADTPGYAGRDVNFKEAMNAALGGNSLTVERAAPTGGTSAGMTDSRHIALESTMGTIGAGNTLAYTAQTQPAMDGNSVDLDRERANFVDNAVRYEATLRFINGNSRTILSAIQGQ